MKEGKITFEQLLFVMYEGWEEKAKELGALTRGREIKTAADLLRLVFIYLTDGQSFSGTAALLKLSGVCSITKRAVFTRFQKCWKWLKWLCENIYRHQELLGKVPQWLDGRRVYAVDASDEPVHGSDKRIHRLHYAVGLFDMGVKEMALTDTKCGEKVSNFKKFSKRDIVAADRAYCSKQGIHANQFSKRTTKMRGRYGGALRPTICFNSLLHMIGRMCRPRREG